MRDDNVVVLDFLATGKGGDRRAEPVAQVIGMKFFSLLEIIPKRDVKLAPGEKVYIGEGERDKVDHIKRRITTMDLTTFAKSELPFVVEKLVKEDEQKFVGFFNVSQPISTRLHQLELLPGIGKKHMWDVINERKKGPFKSFDDLKNRVKLLPDPIGMIVKRILQEIEDEEVRYRLFVAGPIRRF